MTYLKFIFVGFVLVLVPLHQAIAHKVIIFAWVEDGMIFTESSFGSDRKAKDCPIRVLNENGVIVHTGQTNHKGEYAFKVPENIDSDLLLKLDAGPGHQAQWKISKAELAVVPSVEQVNKAHEQKEKLKEKPSIFKILTGVAIIFLLALALKFLKRNNSRND